MQNGKAKILRFNFQGDELEVWREEGALLVVVRRVCDALGVPYRRQVDRLNLHPAVVTKTLVVPSPSGAEEIAGIDVRSLQLWLAIIHPSRVGPELRDKLISYQREAAEVLAEHFLGRRFRDFSAFLTPTNAPPPDAEKGAP